MPAPAAPPNPTPLGAQAKEIGKVIAAYEATGPEQLSLKLNQLIQVKKKSASGWWEGELVVCNTQELSRTLPYVLFIHFIKTYNYTSVLKTCCKFKTTC